MVGDPAIPPPHRRPRVLVVEDEPRLRDLLLDVIRRMDFAAETARTAEEAARLMKADAREILLLDLQLPGMGGMELFEKVREQWPATQVIILTGYGDFDAARSAIRLDVVDFLTKPCPLRDLELALDRARRRVVPTAAAPPAPTPPPPNPAQTQTLADSERQQILSTLKSHDGNRTAAAAALGISRRTLHYRLADYARQGHPIE